MKLGGQSLGRLRIKRIDAVAVGLHGNLPLSGQRLPLAFSRLHDAQGAQQLVGL